MDRFIPVVGAFKLCDNAKVPTMATEGAACFDIAACFGDGETPVKVFDEFNESNTFYMTEFKGQQVFMLRPRYRALIPTGLIFDIPEGFSLRIHPRSSLGWKKGLTLANCEGIIDSDYVHETFVMLYNTGDRSVAIENGERIAQCELVKNEPVSVWEIPDRPEQKTDRTGGFGSTGTK